MMSMKLFKLIFTVWVALVLFSACDDNDDNFEDVWLTTGTIVNSNDDFYILTDGGSVFSPTNLGSMADEYENGLRVLFNYSEAKEATDNADYDYYIKVVDIQEMLTKPVFKFTEETTPDIIDSIGHNPIHIVDTWITDDYLNVQFEYWAYNEIHFVNLVYDSEMPKTEEGEYLLELRHNANNDYYKDWSWGVASFNIEEFQDEAQDTVQFFIRSIGFDNEYEYNKVITYRYENPESLSSQRNLKSTGIRDESLVK